MSTQQLRKRVEKVHEKVWPEHDGTYTWEQFNRLMWRQDKQRYLEIANSPDGYMCRSIVAQFEREDAERAAQESTPEQVGVIR